jgi:hypothetical protein
MAMRRRRASRSPAIACSEMRIVILYSDVNSDHTRRPERGHDPHSPGGSRRQSRSYSFEIKARA